MRSKHNSYVKRFCIKCNKLFLPSMRNKTICTNCRYLIKTQQRNINKEYKLLLFKEVKDKNVNY